MATAMLMEPAVIENGAVMPREMFHRVYAECEDYERVELIEGVVYMPSPIKIVGHAREQKLALRWLVGYEETRDGDVEAMGSGSVLLDAQNEPIPDAMLYYLRPDRFEDGYLNGAPELIFEVAYSSVSKELHQKKRAYERNGVREYIVWRVRQGAIDWFQLRDGAYVQRTPDARGMIESEVFPGLLLNVGAMVVLNRKAVLGALATGQPL